MAEGSLFSHSEDPFLALSYRLEPDYAQPLRGAPPHILARIRSHLAVLYGEDRADSVARGIDRLIKVHDAHSTPELRAAEASFEPRRRFSERDVVLITYGDLVVSPGKSPLKALSDFAFVLFRGLITTVHVLPFYPSSSDRGFSVISYEEVDPALGSWEEVIHLGHRFRLMFDGVFNHVSSKSRRFQKFLAGDPDHQDVFRVFSSRQAIDEDHLRLILRPRTSDLLSEYATVDGTRFVWTTFSRDQIDLNFRNPKVLLDVLDTLLTYVRRGADLVRLDAVTYIWHELGTRCAHLKETHAVVKLFRDVLDAAASHVALVTETNVPHVDNVTYFGDGTDEAQMVYNFALPPLVFHAFVTGSAQTLSVWADALQPPSQTTGFFNFLDSHDGIGLMGARGLLRESDIELLCQRVRSLGGFVSMKSNGDGTQSPYELNVTWYSALNDHAPDEPVERQVDRFLASRAIALAIRGVPGIYLPSFFGARNDLQLAQRDGQARSINRAALREEWLLEQFSDPGSIPSRIAGRLLHLLSLRASEHAFHPAAPQASVRIDKRVFALTRRSPDGSACILCLVDVSGQTVSLDVDVKSVGLAPGPLLELVSGRVYSAPRGRLKIEVQPYQTLWLRGAGG